MKNLLLSVLLLAIMSIFSSLQPASAYAETAARVEVLYMNHGPLLDTLDELKSLFSGYGQKITVSWYDFESKRGRKFMAEKGINRHVPLVIWIDGKAEVRVGQKQIQFVGFPSGAGPASFRGKWSIEDVRAALDQATAEK